ARGVSASHAGAHTVRQAPTERTERRLEQAVLVVEVMRHQTRRDLGPVRDLREGAADIARLRETIDGDLDQLAAANILELVARDRTAALPVPASDPVRR